MEYRERIVDQRVKKQLKMAGAVVIEGPKACGKTMTGQHFANSSYILDDSESTRQLAELDPDRVLKGEAPRLIDEWQFAPVLWNKIRHEVDNRQSKGQFILTGSSYPSDDKTRHSGIGRFVRTHMRPMSLWESGDSTGEVSLGELIKDKPEKISGLAERTVSDLIELTCRGGWPGNLHLELETAIDMNLAYIDELTRTDINTLDGVSINDPENLKRLLFSIARNTSTIATLETLAKETFTGDQDALNDKTVIKYLNALSRLMIYEPLPAWSTHLRSKARLQKKPKVNFVDPAIGAAALDASPDMFLSDLKTYGFFFESLVVRDLRVYAEANDATLYHYRDDNKLEADIIIQTRKGWIPVEVKLSDKEAEAASHSLEKVVNNVVEENNSRGPCLGKLVITAGQLASKKHGVWVVPLACMKD